MPDDRTVLDSLLEGRDALILEVQRLSTAISELDAVIGQIGGGQQRLGNGVIPVGFTVTPDATTSGLRRSETVNSPVEVEASARTRRPSRTRKTTARKASGRSPVRSAARSSGRPGEAPKSIRVHVLDMLAAEDREFGLAEIIDRVHDAGIQAHDDAVRSITIKLMKDGRVERVGRGQYRLAARGARHAAAGLVGAAEDEAPASEDVVVTGADIADDVVADDTDTDGPDSTDESPASEQGPQESAPFTPPLNLGQPWERD